MNRTADVFGRRHRKTSLTQFINQISATTFKFVEPVTNIGKGYSFIMKGEPNAPPPHSPAAGSTTNSLPRPGTKQVTVTVKETVVEPAPTPTPTPVQQQTIATTRRHASSATRELDDLMASLSDFKAQGVQPQGPASSRPSRHTAPHRALPVSVYYNIWKSPSWATAGNSRPRPAPAARPARPPRARSTPQLYIASSVTSLLVVGGGGVGEALPASGAPGTRVYRERRAWQEHYHSGARPAPEPASLEHMLGSLRADMSRQGVQTPQKGCCNACEKPIVGQVPVLPATG
ncbi:hypothetical protein EVAR_74948_1 [Eumeta japonica]|uniref:Uncharacterized protein n=1 Tax=Eumeta variegata TaxID=151549 RepID=A0A4C1UJP7_EUMVA|nr:hypothetical protein EVAR_74948_1 [Eumeta japonica]